MTYAELYVAAQSLPTEAPDGTSLSGANATITESAAIKKLLEEGP